MTIAFNIEDGGKNKRRCDVHKMPVPGEHNGLVTLTERFLQFNPATVPFTNDTYGEAMNQNVAFGGTPELITDGGSGGTEWAGTANAGTWNFADVGKVTITSAENNDNATFDDAGSIDMNGYTAITGLVDLDTYNPANNTILIQFGLAGTPVGNSINLNDYIDTGDFSEQAFSIPKDDLGIGVATVDEMTITITRSGGTRPTIKFDDIQIEQTGSNITFLAEPENQRRLHVKEIRFAVADNVNSVVTVAGATENATLPGLSYDAILGVSALTNGVVLQVTRDGENIFTSTLRQLSDFLTSGSNIINTFSDGTNTFIDLAIDFDNPIILDRANNDRIAIIISDNLSGLLKFSALARGSVEITLPAQH